MTDHAKIPTLKPCPFCGGKNESFAGMFKEAFGTCGDKLIVCCDECDCMGSAGNSMEEAIEAWNTRAPIYIIDTGSTEQYGGKFTRPEPTDAQIEAASRAIHIARMGYIINHDNDWEWVNPSAKKRFRDQAKAALLAAGGV